MALLRCALSMKTEAAVERLLPAILLQKLPMVLILNQVDRFATELRLPPGDTYHKLRHTHNIEISA